MCIAIYSPIGNPVPTEAIFKNCFTNNPDGAGFAFNIDGHVQIVKGLMTFDKFLQTFNEYAGKYGFTDRGVLIHFRITTHGGTQPSCCHPFPLSDNPKMLKKTECTTNFAVVHNGIITLTSYEATASKGMSDTMIFVRDYMSKIATNKGWFKNPNNWELIESLAGSKIACLNGAGQIECTSGFHQGVDGNFYSNTSYSDYYYSYRGKDAWETSYASYDYGYSDVDEEDGILMKLRPDEEVWFNDGYYEAYDGDIPTYIGKTGNVYQIFDCLEPNISAYVDEEDLVYMGKGCFVQVSNPCDENAKPIPVAFREDAYVTYYATSKSTLVPTKPDDSKKEVG